MKIDVYEMTVPQFINTLNALKGILKKSQEFADKKKIDMSVLLQTRLIADQFPLSKQIQIACDSAKFCASRLTGVEAPTFDDKEQTIDQFYTRIDNTISYLERIRPEQFEGYEKRIAKFTFRPGLYLEGKTYLVQHAIPNFYFHVTTAYSILRANGLDIGKVDFLGNVPWKKE